MKKVLFFICCALLLISCETEKIVEVEKEVVVEVEKQYKWKSHYDFKYQYMVQMNSYAADDYLFFEGLNAFLSRVPESEVHPLNPFGGPGIRFDNWYKQPHNKKMPICADYIITYGQPNGKVIFAPTMNPLNRKTTVSIDIQAIDDTFSDFATIYFAFGECMKINKHGQALIPYESLENKYKKTKIAWVDIKIEQGENDLVFLDTLETKIIAIPDIWDNDVLAIESIGDYFYLSTDSKVYRIDKFGNIDSTLDNRLYRIIESSGKLYGISDTDIYISSNEGLTWEKGYPMQSDLVWLTYTTIDNKIVGYYNGQLWEIIVNEKELVAKELDNDGLDGISITSVSEFDEKVYLTTLGGVFYKSVDEFFEYKEEEE